MAIRRAISSALILVAALSLVGCDKDEKKTDASRATRADAKKESGDKGYMPPTAEEKAPMRPEYLAELAKIHEPPEMVGKPMQIREAVSNSVVKIGTVMNALGSPDKATHQQRVTAIHDLLEIISHSDQIDGSGRKIIYGGIAITACIDGADPQTVIGYANSMGDGGDALALRARMYLRAGDRKRSLDDLEKIMTSGDGHVLVDGGTDPRKDSSQCGWSIADIDALGSDPRVLAVKGLYLSSFIGFGAYDRGTIKESDILDLYARSANSWRSPIPHFLKSTTLGGLGSDHSVLGARCLRGLEPSLRSDNDHACKTYDEGVLQELRGLTMALVIDPQFSPARSARAEKYLQLAQSSYADGKPSREYFELAIKDFTLALASQSEDQHSSYIDRALALASLGRYQEAASEYIQGMKHAESGMENYPFVYEQLANVYIKLAKFNEVADLITQAIIHVSGGGMDSVILGGGIDAFRSLYPEYDNLPDEILADVVRRRYFPQFSQSWDTDFISGASGYSKDKRISPTTLPELFVLRGDAYMKTGRRAEALADYRRVKSDVWRGDEKYLPRHVYFDERGMRNSEVPGALRSPPKL